MTAEIEDGPQRPAPLIIKTNQADGRVDVFAALQTFAMMAGELHAAPPCPVFRMNLGRDIETNDTNA